MMDRDTITRSGARTSGVGREPERWHGSGIILPTQYGNQDVTPRPCEGGCNPTKQPCLPGAGLSER